jgi:hypothetical protein
VFRVSNGAGKHTANISVMSNPSAAIAAGWEAAIVRKLPAETRNGVANVWFVLAQHVKTVCQHHHGWCCNKTFMIRLVHEFGLTTYMQFVENSMQIFRHSVTGDWPNFGDSMAKSHHRPVLKL